MYREIYQAIERGRGLHNVADHKPLVAENV